MSCFAQGSGWASNHARKSRQHGAGLPGAFSFGRAGEGLSCRRNSSRLLVVPDDSSSHHYTGQAGRLYHDGKRALPEAAIPWVARLRATKIAPHIKPADAVLEYGVGSGWNLAMLECRRKIGYDVAAFLEPVVRRQQIEFVTETDSLAGGSVDVVLCHHALEHLLTPSIALGEMRRLLRPGGKLLLFVPFETERRYRTYRADEPNHHLYAWNVQTLGNLVTESGFELLEGKVARFGYDRIAAVMAEKLHLGETGFRLLRSIGHLCRPAREVRVIAVRPEERG